jgi:hypothetical protein
VLARLRCRVCRNIADTVARVGDVATSLGRPGRAAALGFTAASVSAVIGLAVPGTWSAHSAATVEVTLARPGDVIIVSAAIEEETAPTAVEAVFVVAAAEPTPSAEPPAATPVPVAVAAVQQAAAASAGTVAAPPAGKHYTAEEVASFARQAGWPNSLTADVVTVAVCESSLFSGAMGGSALGLMQVVGFWFDKAGIDGALWSDPVANLRVAYYVYSYGISNGDAPWSAWGCKPAPPAPTPAAATPAPTGATPLPSAAVVTPSPAAKNTALSAAPAERR